VWDLKLGRPMKDMQHSPWNNGRDVGGIGAVSCTDGWVFTYDAGGTLRQWNVATGEHISANVIPASSGAVGQGSALCDLVPNPNPNLNPNWTL